jgi:hypothetical protein
MTRRLRRWLLRLVPPLALALAGCGSGAPEQPPLGVSPQAFPERLALLARDRWEAASGLRLDVGPGMAPLTFDAELEGERLDCRSENELAAELSPHPCLGRTRVARRAKFDQAWVVDMAVWRGAQGDDCRTLNVLMHEWGHALMLASLPRHLTEDGFLMSPSGAPESSLCGQIDAASLALICEEAPCATFVPEAL